MMLHLSLIMDVNLQNVVESSGFFVLQLDNYYKNGGPRWLEILVLHAVDVEEKV